MSIYYENTGVFRIITVYFMVNYAFGRFILVFEYLII